ncbi:MAG: hypothetical protein K8S97_10060, partial [Anaerolineae bacterium]|nr:hypothetical protein [Anaerolineae bacterium]
MNTELRRRLVYRLDLILIVLLLITSGVAAVLFVVEFDRDGDDDDIAVNITAEPPTVTQTAVATNTLL